MPKQFSDCLQCKCSPKATLKHINFLTKAQAQAPTPELQEEIQSQIMALTDCMDQALKHKSGRKPRLSLVAVAVALGVTLLAMPGLALGLRHVYSMLRPESVDAGLMQEYLDRKQTWWVVGTIGGLLLGLVTFLIIQSLMA